jgi:hypothetical protein
VCEVCRVCKAGSVCAQLLVGVGWWVLLSTGML